MTVPISDSRTAVALVVAAGVGARAGGALPKQYARLGNAPMLTHTLRALLAHPALSAVQVVIHPDHAAYYAQAVEPIADARLLPPVMGGAERHDSVAAGMAALAGVNPDYVLIHDAARPFLSGAMIDRLLAAVTPEQGALPALPVVDTLRHYRQGAWTEVPRAGMLRMQTPQAFGFEALRGVMHPVSPSSPTGGEPNPPSDLVGGSLREGESLASSDPLNPTDAAPQVHPTDEAAIWLAAGKKLVYVQGDERLRKVTNPDDMAWAVGEYARAAERVPYRMAVGMGYDVHTLMPAGEKQRMRIGGIDIPHHHKFHGHSDADVVLHAVVDAILGGLAEGDIGQHFPPSDPQWKEVDSALFVEHARRLLAARGGVLSHLDITIICEAPKIGPHRDAMRARIAELLQVPLTRVSVKATTTEKLGFTGRGEGVAAHALATLQLPEDL